MVIAGVVIDKKDSKKLRAFGVKDSKQLSPRKREALALNIENIARSIIILRIPSCKIDSYMKGGRNLNKIEAMKMAEIISMCDASKVYVDSLNPPTKKRKKQSNKFKDLVQSFMQHKKNINMIFENHLDQSVPVVSAASIIAKVERDRAIEEVKKKVNFNFGVGYSHDARAIRFLEKVLQENKKPSNYIRWSWGTVQATASRLLEEGKKLQPWAMREILGEESWQRKLKDFIFRKKEKCKEEKG